MKRDHLDEAIQTALSTISNGSDRIQVGMSDVPSETPTVPYLILYQSPSPHPRGSYKDPEDMPYLDYHVKSVGRNHKETSRVSSQVREVMITRGVDGYLIPIDADGITIVSRETVSEGIVSKSSGPDLFEKDDIYRICTTGA